MSRQSNTTLPNCPGFQDTNYLLKGEISRPNHSFSSLKLIKAVASDFETPQARSDVQKALKDCFAGAQPTDSVQRSLAHLREVSKILDAKAPADAAAFKTWLRSIGQNVAEAASEGSFLGLGGVRVSDAEKATLDDIAEALGTA